MRYNKDVRQSCLPIILAAAFLGILLPGGLYANSLPLAPQAKIVFLTFDADMTRYMMEEQKAGLVKQWYDPALIQYLDKESVPATFFVTGMFADMYPDLVRSLASNPNFSIQNHTYNHLAFKPECFGLPFVSSDEKKRLQISRTQNILKSLIGRSPKYFRYPGLCHNAHDDALVSAIGLSLAQGEFSSGDAYMKNPETIMNNVLRNLSQGKQVAVFHLGNIKTPETLAAIKLLILKLKELGYSLGHL